MTRRRRLWHWLGDTVRLPVDFLVLNGSKSLWRLRGQRDRCPCQDASDSGRAGETRCDAVLAWHQPRRFRRVCPLLQETAAGWRCGVDTAGVRPFWGRAGLWALALLGGSWLGAGLAAWCLLAVLGYRGVTPAAVLWPPRWTELRSARAELFRQRAWAELARGELDAARVALLTAWEVDAGDYRTGLLLGQVLFFRGDVSGGAYAFEQLLQRHPERTAETALAYHDAVLGVRWYPMLADLALRECLRGGARTAEWGRSLLFALRAGRGAEAFLRARGDAVARLAPHLRLLLEAEALRQAGGGAAAAARLAEPFAGPWNPEYALEQIAALRRSGAASDAEELLGHYGRVLGPREAGLAAYANAFAGGDPTVARAELRGALAAPVEPYDIERACAVLVLAPDRGAYGELVAAIDRHPLKGGLPVSALWLAALRCGAEDGVRRWAEAWSRRQGWRLPDSADIDLRSWNISRRGSLPSLIQFAQLPRDVVMALLEGTAAPEPGRQKPVAKP